MYRKALVQRYSRKAPYIFGGDGSLKPAPRLELLQTAQSAPLDKDLVRSRFQHVHRVNETLHCPDGAWVPQPLLEIANDGISVEEVALRVRGYLAAYNAVGDECYLDRARQGCQYLLSKRIYKDGHIHLLGHTVIDITYAFVGEALLAMYVQDNSWQELLDAARKIGDRLVDYHIAGSVNHAIVPVQLLAPLYQATGDSTYLKHAIKRIFRTALPLQLPYGGWLGHESWIWYHAMILRSLVLGYAAIPNTLDYYAKKDRVASSIIAAINRFVLCQNPDGSLPIRPPQPLCEFADDAVYRQQKALLATDGDFQRVHDDGLYYGPWNGYVIDALVSAYEVLDIREVLPVLNRFAGNIACTDLVWRLEFDTLGSGRLLEYTHKIAANKRGEKLANIQ